MTDATKPPASMLEPRILVPFLVISLIWGSTWLVIRDQVSSVPPGWSISYRFAIAALAMFVLARSRGVSLNIGRHGALFALLLGLTQFTLNFNFVYNAERFLTSGVVAVQYALLLVPNSILAWIVFRQPVSRGFIIGSAIAIAGVALLFLHEYRFADVDPDKVVLGILLGCGGLLAASVSNVMQGARVARRLPMLALLAWAMLAGAVIDAVFAWVTVGPPQVEMRWSYLGGVVYLALLGSVVTFPLYFKLIQDIGPGRAAYSGVLTPVIAMLLSTLFEGYVWSPLAIAGAALSLLGMVVALWAKAQPYTSAASPSR